MCKKKTESDRQGPPVSGRYAIPFLLVLAILTVVAFLIPLRPTQSYREKRALAEFPVFSLEALTDGSYFDDITLWFSDTFPGRERWLDLSTSLSGLHGDSHIGLSGDLPIPEAVPEIPDPPVYSEPPEAATETATEPPTEPEAETEPEETIVVEQIAPPEEDVEVWGGVDAGNDNEIIYGNSSIQIGDRVFQFCSFSQMGCNRYIRMANTAVETLSGKDVQVAFVPAPTAIGIMVSNNYMEKLHCSPQDQIIDYILGGISDTAVKVDVFDTLVAHNSEYIYFNTDHHWTARGAYYAYAETMTALGREPAALENFEEWNQGDMEGSLYWGAKHVNKLTRDTLYAYVPEGDIQMIICRQGYSGFDWPMLTDRSNKNPNAKYMAFLSGDHALCIITNNDLPDAPNCLIIKDSYGNALVPFLTQNYHKVYVIDYRKYSGMGLGKFVDEFQIDDVIFLNNLNGAQAAGTNDQLDHFVK